jgi:hypothetical protein
LPSDHSDGVHVRSLFFHSPSLQRTIATPARPIAMRRCQKTMTTLADGSHRKTNVLRRDRSTPLFPRVKKET